MDRYDRARRRRPQPRARRSALGYWLPLVLTVTVATAGLAAWIWSERQQNADHDHDHDSDDDNDHDDEHKRSIPAHERPPSPPPDTYDAPSPPSESRSSFLARVSRRTPSPQQLLDGAGQRIAAGVAAAGAAVGLSSVRESGRDVAFSDHEGWNEEAESRRARQAQPGKARRTVAVVLSAHSPLPDHDDDDDDDDDDDYRTEHASILSHLPEHFNPDTTRLFVLIYAPTLSSLPSTSSPNLAASSTLSSSYSQISAPATPTSSPSPEVLPSDPSSARRFDALRQQALALVDRPSMILPFSTPTGYIHLLRHLAPSLVYLADAPALSGDKGEHVAQLKGWVGQTILVVGDDGHGGLADTETETEDEGPGARNKWWDDSAMVGLGKDVEVVDADRIGDDWRRRIQRPD